MKILFLGGDARQKHACEFLQNNGYDADYKFNLKLTTELIRSIQASSVIVLPLPISSDGIYITSNGEEKLKICEILNHTKKGVLIFGGKIGEVERELFDSKNIKYIDYFNEESFQINNAILSAEGAIYYAKQRFDKSIYNAKIAILGFGRIGKLLLYMLRPQGAKIDVYARKDSDLAWSAISGANAVKLSSVTSQTQEALWNDSYDIIFNTIPYNIINEDTAMLIDKNTLIVDVSSPPFGIDEKLIDKYKLNYHKEPSIPGRYAPKTAGEIIGNTILNNIICGGN